MRMQNLSIPALAAFLLFTLGTFAFEEVPVPVRASLVANVDSIEPGESFKLGVLIKIEPGWHIYWKNSGDTGLPTTVKYKLPEGFTEGGLLWPIPKTFKSKGDITDYGYEEELLLYSKIKAPEGLKAGTDSTFNAKVSWISCKDICIPGRSDLALTLPVNEKSGASNTDTFKSWESALPLSQGAEDSPFAVEIERKGSDDTSEVIMITLHHKKVIRGIELYPNPGENLDIKNIVIDSTNKKTDIILNTEVLSQEKPDDEKLELLVGYEEQSGARSGIELFIPVVE